ncbi:hypothetical protein V490_03402 [Pseudogymnoascus sp. VKM F-3557]|nr:hypothetical protein V490_03402 [Pseudogymnoascus sp. VKM F-3557]
MLRLRQSRLVKICAFGLLLGTIYGLFSPWKIIIEIRSASAPPDIIPDPTPDIVIQDDITIETPEEFVVIDDIKQNFGPLEESFQKLVREPPKPPKRSRDESIKLIYDSKSPDDWLDLVEGHDGHGLMALTKATQRYIYQKQNPSGCDGQKFLVLNKFPGDDAFGLGAIVQRISDYLSIAIQTNSILLYSEDSSPGEHFIQDPSDGGDESCGRSFDCIFQKLSKCKSKSQKGMGSKAQSVFDMPGHDTTTVVDAEAYLQKHGTQVPPVFEAALRSIQPDITSEMLKYWWRAQAAAFIMRLNKKASARMKELRLGTDTKQLGIQWDVDGQPQDVDFPFPMPEGTISMHVRHGDKGSEMRLVPFNDYVVRAEKFTAENPLGSWKRAFLSTEDPNVIEQMKSMARLTPFSYSGSNARWTWYWSGIPRLNTSPETQLREFGNRTDLTIKWLLQLVMAIECDVFVGTRGSGWNRLIDSLRCVWLPSCKQPFLEVGFETDWAGYGP